MPNKLAVLRASSSPKIGGGHITRCVSLAQKLTELGWDIIFASEPQTSETTPFIKQYDIIVLDYINQKDEANIISKAIGQSISFLIVDHYERNNIFESTCRLWAKHIMVIDDLPTRIHDADLLLDQSGGRQIEHYKNLVPAKCKLLIGPEYSLLRQSFFETAQKALYPRNSSNKRIFVSMGAVDFSNLTKQVVEILFLNYPDFYVDIILSKTAPHLNEIAEFCSKHGNFQLHIGTTDPSKIMAQSTFAIGTAGVNLWERCSLGIPSIIFIAAENQRANAHYVIKNGGGIYGGEGETLSANLLVSAILQITKNLKTLLSISKAASNLCDGMGASRVAKIITTMHHSANRM